jgi:hypothetical protein
MKNRPRFETQIPTDQIPDHTHLEIDVFYGEGGINYFNYKDEPRGYWVSLRPIKMEGRCKSFVMFDDKAFKVFLEPAKRFNANRLNALGALIMQRKDNIARLFLAKDREGIKKLASDVTDGFTAILQNSFGG